jgi:dCTP deaminase
MSPEKLVCAELIERAIRMHFVAEKSQRLLDISIQRETAQGRAAKELQRLVKELVLIPISESLPVSAGSRLTSNQLRSWTDTLAKIHQYALPTVPRAVDPIELRSFLRQSPVKNDLHKQPLVFASERLGIQTYPNSLYESMRDLSARNSDIAAARDEIFDLRELTKRRLTAKLDLVTTPAEQDRRGAAFVSLPCVDIENPRRWPSLWHEVGHHHFFDSEYFDDFERYIDDTLNQSKLKSFYVSVSPLAIDSAESETTVARSEFGRDLTKKWFVECWCDFFGAGIAGFAFLFSQLHDFVFSSPTYISKPFVAGQYYPSASFRLRLSKLTAIEKFRHLKDGSGETDKLIALYESELLSFHQIYGDGSGSMTPLQESATRVLHQHFLQYFKVKGLNHGLFDETCLVSFAALADMSANLTAGMPIPSVLLGEESTRRRAYCSEIVLAGWIDHTKHLGEAASGGLRSRLLETFEDTILSAEDKILKARELIDRSDECLKRSIQVSEWFHIFQSKNEDTVSRPSDKDPHDKSSNSVLLSDREIRQLLAQRTLEIIPLLDPRTQIEGTRIDLRLGHNFEIFLPGQKSLIDAMSPFLPEDPPDSYQVEVDLLAGKPIQPGQFILGHTLEYIKLPRNVAAQIEGRSSFARVGIQVHMTANLIEAGFEGCLTLEILNNGPSAFMLYPGMRIAQIRLFRVEEKIITSYMDKPSNKYKGQLSQNRSKQFSDSEVGLFRTARERRGFK